MENKEDWKELEKWNEQHKQKLKEQYKGVDIMKLSEENKESKKKIKKANKVLGKVGKVIAVFYIIFIVLLIIIGTTVYINKLKEIRNKVDIDVVKTLKETHNANFVIKSKKLDDKGNGTLHLSTKGKIKIKFDVVKKFGNMDYNYDDESLRYFYEKWNSDSKNIFEVEEYTNDNGLKKYVVYTKADSIEKIDNAINAYMELKEFAGNYYEEFWPVELRDGEYKNKLIPISGDVTLERVKNMAKREFVMWHIDNNADMPYITEEEQIKYYKPDRLKLIINGDIVINPYNNANQASYLLYDYVDDSYCIPLRFLEKVDGMNLGINEYNQILSMTYKGKKYIVAQEQDLENCQIKDVLDAETLTKITGAEVKFDFKNEKVYVNF